MLDCTHCGQSFSNSEEDLRFYELVSPMIAGKKYLIPPPTHCPTCRRRRRLAWRNEKTLYRRTCDYSRKPILSIYSPDKPFTVYDSDIWNSDVWDPLSYGREIDWNRPFFDQWNDLHHAVPLPSFNLRFQNENSEYTNLSQRNKNCYLIFAGNDNEDCYYGTYLHRNHRAVDCFFTVDSESCYECVDVYESHRLLYSEDCRNCADSLLLKSCRGCQNCIGCVNLVNKSYHIGNKPCTKEEFQNHWKSILEYREEFNRARTILQTLERSLPHKAMSGFGNEEVSGDHITNCRNVQDSFDMTNDEDCKYCVWMHHSKNCYDCYGWGMTGELGLENHLVGQGFYNVRFSESCWGSVSDLLYCRYCLDGSSHLFGCIGLRHKEYCILNKQYSQEEYEQLVPRLIDHMRNDGNPAMNRSGTSSDAEGSPVTGSWGEFFPAQLSPYGYNETVAQEYFPMTRDDVLSHGWNWRDQVNESPAVAQTVAAAQLPESIANVPDEITEWAITCEVTGKAFRISQQELAFYRDMNIPLPRKCFDQRHRERMALRNPRKLWDRECAQCHKPIATSYSPERSEIVYCEECYLQEVY